MSSFVKFAVAGLALTALSGCAGLELGKAEGTQATGSAFEKNLYSEYVSLAKSEYSEGDYLDSDNFARRAISAATGAPTGPEALSERKLPEGASGALGDARSRLLAGLAKGARHKMPTQAARAQAMFDCWMQEQEENFQPKDIARCRAGFMTAMAKIDGRSNADFVVYFGFDKAKAVGTEAGKIKTAIDAAKKRGAKGVTLTGHTDRAGASKYNDILSLRRVRAVAAAFKAAGIKPMIISTRALGEKAPSVKTKDGVAKAKNRRVEILIGL